MDEEGAKQERSLTGSVTPFSINDILSRKCKDEMQEKALDMSKASKEAAGKKCFLDWRGLHF